MKVKREILVDVDDRPLYQCYYLGDNIFAGEYPGDKDPDYARYKIRQMLRFGVRHFFDLTEEGELAPYSHFLPEYATYHRMPIKDCSVPTLPPGGFAHFICNMLDHARKGDGYVYLHCWGGVGRTGVAAACCIAGRDLTKSFEDVVYELQTRFKEMPKSSKRITPENHAQLEYIRQYVEGKIKIW